VSLACNITVYQETLENCQCMQNSTFVINRNIKTISKIQKSNNEITQVIDCLDSQWLNALINKSWVSLCSPAHWEFENLCFVLVLERYDHLFTLQWRRNLWTIFLSKYAFIIRHGYEPSTISWWVEKFKWAKFQFIHHCISKLWLFIQAPVDFFLNRLRTKLFNLLDQLSRVVSSAWLNSLGYNLVSWFIFPCRKQKSNKMNFEKCAYIDSFVKLGHKYWLKSHQYST